MIFNTFASFIHGYIKGRDSFINRSKTYIKMVLVINNCLSRMCLSKLINFNHKINVIPRAVKALIAGTIEQRTIINSLKTNIFN